MYYKDPFNDLDKIMKERQVAFNKIAGEKKIYNYHDYIKWYLAGVRDGLKRNEKEPFLNEEERKHYALAENDMSVRLYALEHEKTTPRYFVIDEGLINFLSDMPVMSLKYLQDKWQNLAFYIYTPNTTYYCQCDNFEDDKDSHLFCVKEYGNKTIMYPVDDLDNPKLVFKFIKEQESNAIKRNKKAKETIKKNVSFYAKTFQFCINTLFYTMAFPESIKDGCPTNIAMAQLNELKDKHTQTLKVDERIVRRERNEVTPHFRSGYFRHYVSDRYKKAKGTIQFIEATFVKGKAKTVEDVLESN